MRVIALAIVMLAASIHAVGQDRPDFSGNWVATTDTPANAALSANPLFSAKFAIRHRGTALTLTRNTRNETVEGAFTIGGGEARVRVAGRLCEGDAWVMETMEWRDNSIAHSVVGAINAGGGPVRPVTNMTHLLQLEGPDTLVVRRTFGGRGDTPARIMGTVYKRTSEPMPPLASLPPVKTAPAKISQIIWIAGTWVGPAPPNFSVEERWTPPASGGMVAVGRTLQDPLLVRLEFLCIVEQNDTLVYMAMPNGRMPPTPFALTGITNDSATFENPANGFPKVVRYTRRPDGALETFISGANNDRAETIVLRRRD